MSKRTLISLRHVKHEHYTLVEPADANGFCKIRNKLGQVAQVKAAWLDYEGTDCWPGSWRKSMHIQSADWSAE